MYQVCRWILARGMEVCDNMQCWLLPGRADFRWTGAKVLQEVSDCHFSLQCPPPLHDSHTVHTPRQPQMKYSHILIVQAVRNDYFVLQHNCHASRNLLMCLLCSSYIVVQWTVEHNIKLILHNSQTSSAVLIQ